MTADHCGINAGNAASAGDLLELLQLDLPAPGQPRERPARGRPAEPVQHGIVLPRRQYRGASDFTLVELDDPLLPAFNLFLAGWDRTPNPGAVQLPRWRSTIRAPTRCGSRSRPGTTRERRLAADGPRRRQPHPRLLGHEPRRDGAGLVGIAALHAAGRYIGQLHGGPSACGAADLSDYYGRFSGSWTGGGTNDTSVSNWLDPVEHRPDHPRRPQRLHVPRRAHRHHRDGHRTQHHPGHVDAPSPAPPATTSCAPWAPARRPATSQIATNVAGTTYDDTTVSGGTTYSYVVPVRRGRLPVAQQQLRRRHWPPAPARWPRRSRARPSTRPAPGARRLRDQPGLERGDDRLRGHDGEVQRLPLDRPGLRPRAGEPASELRDHAHLLGHHGDQREHATTTSCARRTARPPAPAPATAAIQDANLVERSAGTRTGSSTTVTDDVETGARAVDGGRSGTGQPVGPS